ncbi:MAG: hypothetical protein ACI4R9_04220 [Kiritimatiellia bacterium]
MIGCLVLTVLLNVQKNGVDLTVASETTTIDPARSTFVTLTLKADKGIKVTPPELRARVRGFAMAEERAEEPETAADGSTVQVVEWQLFPEPCAEVYGIAPFVVATESAAGPSSFWAGPVYFEPPAAREPVTGGMEIDPEKVLPPFSWKLAGWCALTLTGLAALGAGVFFLVRHLARRVKEHRMSPIERAWVELDRLLKRKLPGKGRYKDFYVELTMVVRRYVQRKYGIRAPHLTTEEFFAEIGRTGRTTVEREQLLREFLSSADMVKFAGVQATPEMADEATASARTYLTRDAASPQEKGGAR